MVVDPAVLAQHPGSCVGSRLPAAFRPDTGPPTSGPVSEDAPSNLPLSPYASSKSAAESLLYSYHHLHDMDAVALRYFTVYGPAGRPDMSVFGFIRVKGVDKTCQWGGAKVYQQRGHWPA